MMKNNTKKGFTFIELALALTFLSVLLLTIAWLTMHITSTYEKGLTMKAVNATSKEIIDDVSRAIATSPARSVESLCASKYSGTYSAQAYSDCVKDHARKFSYQQRYGSVKINGVVTQVPINGAFCTGRYSYIWNTAYALNRNDYKPATTTPDTTDYRGTFIYNGGSTKDFRLLKISDFTREICANNLTDTTQYIYSGYYDYKTSKSLGSGSSALQTYEDLLDRDTDGTNTHLALYDFVIFPPTVHKITGSGFYSGSFILASLRGGININSTGEFCSDPPDNLDTDFAYCSINKYNFSMRAAGESTQTDRLL